MIVHVILILIWFQFGPDLHLFQASPEELEARRQELLRQQEQRARRPAFVFVQPRVDLEALKPKPRAELSDLESAGTGAASGRSSRRIPLPFSQGNSSERDRSHTAGASATGPETPVKPDRAAAATGAAGADRAGAAAGRHRRQTASRRRRDRRPERWATRCAISSATCRTRRSTTRRAALTDPGATIQFDTKGVEFGPWLRRFVAQVRRNWFVPYAAMTFRGRVVLQFNIHRDGAHHRHLGRRAHPTSTPSTAPRTTPSSGRTRPSRCRRSTRTPKAFFTVTFYYNEQPAGELTTENAMPTRSQQLGLIILLVALDRLRVHEASP